MPSQNITAFDAVTQGDMTGDWYIPVAKFGVRTKKLLAAPALGGGFQTIITDATTARTLALGDLGALIKMTSSSANTITVPPNSAVAFAVGTIVDIVMYGTGQTSVVAGAGVTINSPTVLDLDGQYSKATLQKIATNEWLLSGTPSGVGGVSGDELLDEDGAVLLDESSVSLQEE